MGLSRYTLFVVLLCAMPAVAADVLPVDTPLFIALSSSSSSSSSSSLSSSSSSSSSSSPEPAACASLRARNTGAGLAIEIKDAGTGTTFHATWFPELARLKGWYVVADTGEGVVPAVCEQALTMSSSSSPAVIATSAGPVYRDEATCRAHTGPAFDLGACAAVVRAATMRSREILAVETARATASRQRLRALWKAGGALFDTACRRWAVTPRGADRARLVLVDADTTTTIDMLLTPRVAVTEHRHTMVGLGSSGSTGGQQSLGFGDERFYLDGEPWFFQRERCAPSSLLP